MIAKQLTQICPSPCKLLFASLVLSGMIMAEEPTPTDDEAIIFDTEQAAEAEQFNSDKINQFIEHIDTREAEFGAYDISVAEGQFSLGKAYQHQHQHHLAIDAFKQARHLYKINNGLFSLAQEPALRELIASFQALKDWDSATKTYSYLFLINEKAYGENDPRMIGILEELTLWHLNLYQHRTNSPVSHLVASSQLSSKAINLITEQNPSVGSNLIELLRHNALSNYLTAAYLLEHQDLPKESDFYFGRTSRLQAEQTEWAIVGNTYRKGREAHEKIINLLYNNPNATLLEKASAYAALGDWFLLFGKKATATQSYQQAVSLTEDPALQLQLEQQLFTPFQILPAHSPESPFDDVNQQTSTIVEIKMDISNFGAIRNVEVISLTPEPEKPKALTAKVKRNLRNSRVRPLMQAGKLTPREGFIVKIRYEG